MANMLKKLFTLPFQKFKEFQKDLFLKSETLNEQIAKMRTDVKVVMKDRKAAESAAEAQSIELTEALSKHVDTFVHDTTQLKSRWAPLIEMDKRLKRGEDVHPEEMINSMMRSGLFDPSKSPMDNFEQLRSELDKLNAQQEHVEDYLRGLKQQVESDKHALKSQIDQHTAEMVKIMREKLSQRDEDVAAMREELARGFKKSSDVTKV